MNENTIQIRGKTDNSTCLNLLLFLLMGEQ